MKLKEIVDELGLKVFCGKEYLDREVNGGYSSDLLSDVMGHAEDGQIWITLQSHMNVVAIASLKELAAVLLVNSIAPDENVMLKALEEKLPLLGTREPCFIIAGKIYTMLNR